MNRPPHHSQSWHKLTTWEVAQQLSHLQSLVFFDSSGNTSNQAGPAISLIAAEPEYLIQGNLASMADQQRLREAWLNHQKESVDCGYPLGGLCGSIDYDGTFSFGHYPQMLIYQHEQQQWHEVGRLSSLLQDSATYSPCQLGNFRATMSREQFISAVERIREWIAAGDIYQVNLTQQFSACCDDDGSLAGLYSQLRDRSPAPMAAWMKMAGREILSSSPETFLRISGRQVETRPIKGTRPRFANADEDRRSAYELQTSPKEISELVMITDLLRNDLGQVCDFGSVRVDEMLQLETFEQVFHLVSTVRGEIRDELDAIDVLAACFPGGSITGAPKKRACEIIKELEPVPRGLYCGAIGYLGYNQESQFNIAIRTLVRENGQLHYHVGAGIVADSVPAMEYEETLHKARGIQLALTDWQNFVQKELNKIPL
ncbi:MAG: aminodeoxychorismate synthase component I [Akkermansiaceae bacterium]